MLVRVATDNHSFCLHLFRFSCVQVELSPERLGIADLFLEKLRQDLIPEAPIQDEIQEVFE